MDAARAVQHHARLLKQFWGPAVLTACHIHNLCLHPNYQTTTPHELLHKSEPDIRYLRTFGCYAYGFIPEAKRDKLDPRAFKGIFIGYGDHQKGYVIYDPETGRCSVNRSVTFDETPSTIEQLIRPWPNHCTRNPHVSMKIIPPPTIRTTNRTARNFQQTTTVDKVIRRNRRDSAALLSVLAPKSITAGSILLST